MQAQSVMSPSVWTHLKPDDCVNYLAQTFRVLRPGGRAYLWFYFSNSTMNDLMQAKLGKASAIERRVVR